MKLSQLYSNTSTFKDIVFNNGINLVIGKVTKNNSTLPGDSDSWKSTLIGVLDFMLLKQIDVSTSSLKNLRLNLMELFCFWRDSFKFRRLFNYSS